ncbi:MAG TPA: hypothetical protein VGM91_11275 [Conexibacter sp.]
MAAVVQRKHLVWIAVWALTRFFMVAQAGFWNHATGPQLQDVYVFRAWSDQLATLHTMPVGDSWQYPPLVAFLLLLPRVSGAAYGPSFVGLMVLVDLAGLALLAVLARREQRDWGVWAWLLLMPCMGAIPLLRFDLVPTVLAIGALLFAGRRALWLGALAGAGAMLKVWPALVLIAEWDRRRLVRAVIAGLVVVVAVLVAAQLAFGGLGGVLGHQEHRGLQLEAVLATPWHVRQLITGQQVTTVFRNGTNELTGSLADTLAGLLRWVTLALGACVVAWWVARERAVRPDGRDGDRGAGAGGVGAGAGGVAAGAGGVGAGAPYLTTLAAGRDAAFTVVLLSVVVSRVLSPQYLIWLVGLVAVVLCSRETRLTRPALIVGAAVVMTVGLYDASPTLQLDHVTPATLVLRNVALLLAALDAAVVMARAVWTQRADRYSRR